MTMPYPAHDTYAHLYARYLRGDRTEQMIAAAGPLAGRFVVDLCTGGGRLASLALAQGACVSAVDASTKMTANLNEAIMLSVQPIAAWLSSCVRQHRTYDVAFCQQAINYWLNPETAAALGKVIAPGGVVVFNTFNRKPAATPTLKEYELDGARFVEASWLTAGDVVQHVQMREGEPPHTTSFSWISPQQYEQWLEADFHLVEHRDGAASVWVCTRRMPMV